MTKDQVIALLRVILTSAGSYLIGKSIFGVAVSDNILQLVIGFVVVAGSFIWSIIDHSLVMEGFQSAIKQVLIAGGGILIAAGKLSIDKLDSYIGVLTPLLIYAYTLISQKKSIAIANGSVAIQDLSGVKKSLAITPALRVAGDKIQTIPAIETKQVVAALPSSPVNTPVK